MRAWLKENIDTAIHQLDRFIVTGEAEDLHQARLSMKRILAFAWLFRKVHGRGKSASCFREWKKIAALAGDIRSCHVHNSLITEFSNDPSLKIKKREMYRRWDTLKKAYGPARHLLLEKRAKGLSAAGRISSKQTMKILDDALRELRDVFKNLHKDKDWHRARILLKRSLFLNVFIRKAQRAKLFLNLSHPLAEKLQKQLGDWHDMYVLQASISDLNLREDKKKRLLSVINITLSGKRANVRRVFRKLQSLKV